MLGELEVAIYDSRTVQLIVAYPHFPYGTTVIEIASWRKKYWLDFDEYYNNSDVLDGGIWID